MTPPNEGGAGTAQSGGQATTALVIGILGILCCQLLGPVAWYLGRRELNDIKAGTAPAAGEGTAKAGMILGIIGTCFLALAFLWIFLMGGLAVLGTLAEGSRPF
jgi:hypothetical protein